ncbi:MAG: hypothetical protein KJ057_13135 [Phycisphaerae bacterium]|nr:hypothetical protein [Planctomycetia bacterium]MCL4719409.1 hypothetical protein [Phycisphaerae bacterium]
MQTIEETPTIETEQLRTSDNSDGAEHTDQLDDRRVIVRILQTGDRHKRLLRVGQVSAGCGWCAHNKVL